MVQSADGPRLVSLLGGAAILVDGVPLGGRASHRHPLALLALLIANGGRAVTRDKLIALLWPERDSDAARNLLKVNVHELRKQLGDAAIRSTGDQLSADLSVIDCDLTEFIAAIARGDDAAAADLYAGPFLDGFFLRDAAEFERWVDGERARIAGLYGAALERLADAAERRGDREATIRWRRAQAAHDPYRPDVAQRLVEALAAAGDRAGMIRFAEAFTQRRRDELGIADDSMLALARDLQTAGTPESAARAVERPSVERTGAGVGGSVAHPPVAHLPAASAARPRMRRVVLGIVTALGIVAALGVIATRTRAGSSPPTAPRVAIVPFRVVGSDSAARAGFVDLLAARFTGEGGAQALEPHAVVAALAGSSKGGAPSLERALAAARSLTASQLIVGEVVGSSDSVVIAARLYAVPSGALVATAHADAPARASMATLADRVAIELLARAAGEPDERIVGLTMRPMAAARRYVAAQLAYRSGRYAAAESLYARALAVDSTFGAAGLGLAMANSWTTINEHYGIGRDAALAHLAAMSERDRLFALAFFGPDPAVGPPHPAPEYMHRWEDLVEKYPDWTEAWYQLGDRYFHYGGLSGLADADDRARHAFERALAQDSSFAAPLHHLVELYASRGDAARLRATGDRYFAINPSVARDRSALGWEMATALGDSGWLRRLRAGFDGMSRAELIRIGWVTDANGWPRGDAERADSIAERLAGTVGEHEKSLISKLSLALNGGRVDDVRRAAAELGAQFPDRPVGALWDLYAATFGVPDSVLANNAVARLASFVRGPSAGDHVRRDQHHQASCLVAYWMANRGDLAGARRSLDRLSADLRTEDDNFAKRNGAVCASMVGATIATSGHAGDARSAVARLDTILLEQRVPPHVILEAGTLVSARLHAALGDTAAALVAARRREHLTGDPILLAAELDAEARYALALGDKDGAARASKHLAALRR